MPAAANEPTQPPKGPKLAYRVKNWAKYNEALVNRGDITFYFCEAVIDAW